VHFLICDRATAIVALSHNLKTMHLPQQAAGNVYCEQEVLVEKEGVHYSILVLYTDVNS